MAEVNFLLHIHKDERIADRLINQISIFHPESHIVVIYDGEANETYKQYWLYNQKVIPIQGTACKSRSFKTEWLKRSLLTAQMFLDKDSVMIKIDPDSYLFRRLRDLPKGEVFGEITANTKDHTDVVPWILRGGARGMRKSFVDKVLESGLLEDSFYRNPSIFSYAKDKASKNPILLTSEDRVLSHICMRLGIVPEAWSDVSIRVQGETIPNNHNLEYSIVHPVF